MTAGMAGPVTGMAGPVTAGMAGPVRARAGGRASSLRFSRRRWRARGRSARWRPGPRNVRGRTSAASGRCWPPGSGPGRTGSSLRVPWTMWWRSPSSSDSDHAPARWRPGWNGPVRERPRRGAPAVRHAGSAPPSNRPRTAHPTGLVHHLAGREGRQRAPPDFTHAPRPAPGNRYRWAGALPGPVPASSVGLDLIEPVKEHLQGRVRDDVPPGAVVFSRR